ncbi:hypothetical protein [Nocardioides sp.]|uniref:hypothetical protein n=1 Tax=Nocardioides sp. TaxID=35761 RepID=UPI002D12F620|nr:hypothetical protein [Nocardioides sp.]HSX67913.1 hypothetical protein [Nocardioides sp.]
MTDTPTSRVPLAARIVLSVLALGVLGYWALISYVLFAIGCSDEYCTGGVWSHDRWRYTAQFLFVAPAATVGIAGLALGFTHRQELARRLLAVAAAVGLGWLVVVLGSGTF